MASVCRAMGRVWLGHGRIWLYRAMARVGYGWARAMGRVWLGPELWVG